MNTLISKCCSEVTCKKVISELGEKEFKQQLSFSGGEKIRNDKKSVL